MFKVIRRLLKFSGKYSRDLRSGFFFNLIFTVSEALAFPAIIYVLRCVVLSVEEGIPVTGSHIVIVFLIMLCSVIGKIVFGSIANSKLSLACFNMCNDKRIAIGNRLKRMPMGYFSDSRLGEVAAVVTTTIRDIEDQFTHLFTNIIVGLAYTVVITIIMFIFQWRIGLISLLALAGGLMINMYLQKKGKVVSLRRQQAQTGLISSVLEYVQGISVIKAFGIEASSHRTLDKAIEDSRVKNLALESVLSRIVTIYKYVFKLASCALILMGCFLLSGGSFTVLNTLMVIISGFVIYSRIESLGGAAALLPIIDDNLNKIEEVSNLPFMDDAGVEMRPRDYNIRFRNVSFAYDTRRILNEVSFDIHEKETVAIVGPSGSGKTTICNLIARFWDVDEGEILIGGENIRKFTCESLLSHISIVFQRVYLFQDTILNNIKFPRPDADLDEVFAAAEKACCHEFIMNLPHGYETMVGEGGGSLSGGERQRISIARAILKDAPIVILDEATSSVDPLNQEMVQKGIEELTKHKTVIMIAHRLSTVENADKIFVLNGGRIVQAGKHEALLGQEGLYKNFIEIRKRALRWSLG